jgi:outer membrane lipase/esterase
MRLQLAAYTGAGGAFGPNDLVSVLGGANNVFQQIQAFAALPPLVQASTNPQAFVQPAVVSAAADINFLVNDIASRGAGTILVTNLPRLGITPQFAGTAAAPLVDFAGSGFNSALYSGLSAVAAAQPNTNIIYFDLYKVSDVLAADPTRFGLTNATQSCFTGLSVCANPDDYLYWDGVHPTAAGHRLIAALANDYLYYGDQGAQSAVQGETAFRQREDMLDMAAETVSGHAAWSPGTHLIFGALGDKVETDARGMVAETSAEGYGARAGLDHVASESVRFGFAASWRTTDVEAGAMSFDLKTYGVDAWAGWRSGSMFVNATAGGAIDQYDNIERISALAPIVQFAETDGGSLGARLQGGLWFDMGGIALSPRAALSWVSADVNGYAETGAAATYQYADRTVENLSGEVSLRAEGGGEGFGFYIEGGYRDSFGDSSDAVHVGIAGNTAQVLAREVEDPFGGSLIAAAGIEADLGPARLTAGYRGRFGDHADSHMGGVTISLPLQ